MYLSERKERGREGVKLELVSNMYQMLLPQQTPLFRYELEMLEIRGIRERDLTKSSRNE